jgi:DNA/RNA-binding domain of Phe-tRNA-synthetase-like protein
MLTATDAFREAFPGAVVGALAMSGVANPAESPALEEAKRALERELRAGEDLDGNPILRAYTDYYRAFGKTFHVKAQWESVAVKRKPIPRRAALVEAMFMAELRSLVLTAGHDQDALAGSLRADVSADGDAYVTLGGAEAVLKRGDMLMADAEGIVSSVLRGPDRRTQMTPATTRAVFAVYAPAGVGQGTVRGHLDDLRANVELIAPAARTEALVVLLA